MTDLSSASITEVMTALAAAAADFRPAVKDATNPHFGSQFVSLNGALDAVRKALLDQGIVVMQPTDRAEDGTTLLLTRLVHTSGEWLGSVYPVRPVKNDPQSEGSALTYARRYALMSLVGIAPEDDDGHAASQRPVTSDERGKLRDEIGAAAKGMGLTSWTDTAADFASWSTGESMNDATDDQLRDYRDYLRKAASQ